VADKTQLESAVTSYISQGFTVQQQSETSVTMFKAKKFEILWAVLGFILCLLPLLIYCIVYATQNDEMVVITVGAAEPQLALSPDRSLWWDGSTWQDATQTVPPNVPRSPDNTLWWDGVEWRAVPGAGAKVADPQGVAQGVDDPPPAGSASA
jgi:hypothetical protein